MNRVKTRSVSTTTFTKWKDYTMLIKMRLSLVVVFTSLIGFLIAAQGMMSLRHIVLLFLGGIFTTGAANAMNQVLEKDYDILMTRTKDRPVAAGRMKTSEAVMFAGLSCLIGISILALFNPVTAVLGMLSFIIYAFIYTPLKRYSTLAVAVGAIPGALPVMIGFTSYSGSITMLAIVLFAIQFLWQFPHFWSIGFLAYDDYKGAGYKLLPEKNGRMDPSAGLHAAIYALLTLPIVIAYYYVGQISIIPTIITIIAALVYAWLSYKMYTGQDRKSALVLMFGSFIYLPIVLIAYLVWI